ncbi:hypothetical protein [Neptuniibacter sp. QD57_21]|uniref:hypothetical protein n=1 Tax=Neptuniibacter sp. QD57_21 TaxID=3398213 RepID=UPI0039F5D8FF
MQNILLEQERSAHILSTAPMISGELWHKEPELNHTRWYDYRMTDPVTLTELFAEKYIKVFREQHAKNKDFHEAEKKQPIKSANLIELRPTEVTSLWLARQCADQYGIAYDTAIRIAFNTLVDRQYKKLPRPNQLYSAPVKAAYEKHIGSNSYIGPFHIENEQFCYQNYRKLALQDTMIKDLVTQIKKSDNKRTQATNIAIQMEKHFLNDEVVIREFGTRIHALAVEKKEECSNTPRTDFHEEAYKPSCWGIPHSGSQATLCSDCSFQTECGKARNNIEALLEKNHGTSDPKLEEKRRKAAERQRRHREKKRQEKQLQQTAPA